MNPEKIETGACKRLIRYQVAVDSTWDGFDERNQRTYISLWDDDMVWF